MKAKSLLKCKDIQVLKALYKCEDQGFRTGLALEYLLEVILSVDQCQNMFHMLLIQTGNFYSVMFDLCCDFFCRVKEELISGQTDGQSYL